MTFQELIGWCIVAGPILATAGGLVGAALVKYHPASREVATAGADYLEAVKKAVELAERYGVTNRLPGADKFAVAVKEMDAWMDAQGIHGDARRVTLEKARADIELMRAWLFPKKAA